MTFEQALEHGKQLLAILTGEAEGSALEVARHAMAIASFILDLFPSDKPVIGLNTIDSVEFTNDQKNAIAICLTAGDGLPAEGVLGAWALKLLISRAIAALLDLISNWDEPKTVGKLGDGTFLKVLLENLPSILAAILAMIEQLKSEE